MSRDFLRQVFSMNHVPQASGNNIRVILSFLKIHGDIRESSAPPISTPQVANLPPVSNTPAANLPPVSMTQAVNLPLLLLVSLILVANNGNNIRLLTP
jgi:hypothetical protein